MPSQACYNLVSTGVKQTSNETNAQTCSRNLNTIQNPSKESNSRQSSILYHDDKMMQPKATYLVKHKDEVTPENSRDQGWPARSPQESAPKLKSSGLLNRQQNKRLNKHQETAPVGAHEIRNMLK